MKSYGLKLFKPLVERNLLIVIPKEAGIVEAGAQNSLIAMADDGHASRFDLGIQNREEMGRQGVLVILECEVFLMVTHDRDQNFFRQRQVFRLKVAQEHAWPLGKVSDLLHQGLVFRQRHPGTVRVAASRALRMRWRRAATSAITKAASSAGR